MAILIQVLEEIFKLQNKVCEILLEMAVADFEKLPAVQLPKIADPVEIIPLLLPQDAECWKAISIAAPTAILHSIYAIQRKLIVSN